MNGTDRMSLQQLAVRWLTEGWQKGNTAIVDELHAPAFVDHDPDGRPPDREGFKQGLIELYAAFPDFHAEIEDLAIDTPAQKITVRWRGAGTHQGVFLGYPPTGRRIYFKGIEILHHSGRADHRTLGRMGRSGYPGADQADAPESLFSPSRTKHLTII